MSEPTRCTVHDDNAPAGLCNCDPDRIRDRRAKAAAREALERKRPTALAAARDAITRAQEKKS